MTTIEADNYKALADALIEAQGALRAVREWLTNGHRGAFGEPVPLVSMLEVIDSVLP